MNMKLESVKRWFANASEWVCIIAAGIISWFVAVFYLALVIAFFASIFFFAIVSKAIVIVGVVLATIVVLSLLLYQDMSLFTAMTNYFSQWIS